MRVTPSTYSSNPLPRMLAKNFGISDINVRPPQKTWFNTEVAKYKTQQPNKAFTLSLDKSYQIKIIANPCKIYIHFRIKFHPQYDGWHLVMPLTRGLTIYISYTLHILFALVHLGDWFHTNRFHLRSIKEQQVWQGFREHLGKRCANHPSENTD